VSDPTHYEKETNSPKVHPKKPPWCQRELAGLLAGQKLSLFLDRMHCSCLDSSALYRQPLSTKTKAASKPLLHVLFPLFLLSAELSLLLMFMTFSTFALNVNGCVLDATTITCSKTNTLLIAVFAAKLYPG
jgi:hypothetical protein